MSLGRGSAPRALLLLASAGCQKDYRVGLQEEDKVPVAQPDSGVIGDDAPDWADCTRGWRGQYYNHLDEHPDFGELSPTEPPFDPGLVDWWDPAYGAFERYDATLDIGPGFWPVDQGFPDDPAYFAVRWTAWVYVDEVGPVTAYATASTDLWVEVGEQPVAQLHSAGEATSEAIALELPLGQSPVTVYFAQRRGESVVALRFVGEGAHFCYPDFGG